MEWLGILGNFLFVLATSGQTLKSIRDGHSNGVSAFLLGILAIGYPCAIIYVIGCIGWDLILLGSYTFQATLWGIVGFYKYFPRRK
jgi:uncharacterized protein with PQ loop repeat